MTQPKKTEKAPQHQQDKYTGNELDYVKRLLGNEKGPWKQRLERAFAP